jgi:cytochrome b6-f complex iron-sulfur subunit
MKACGESGGRRFAITALLSFFAASTAFADGGGAAFATANSWIITLGFLGLGILAVYVLFLISKFLLQTYKAAKARKAGEAPKNAGVGGGFALSFAFWFGLVFAVLSVATLFVLFLCVIRNMNLSSTRPLGAAVIFVGFIGLGLFFLYGIFSLASAFLKAVWKRKPHAAVETPAMEGVPPAGVTRRSFLSLLGWAWVAFTAASLGALSTVLRFFFPNVTFEPPLKFKVGFPKDFGMGVDNRFKSEDRIWIVRNEKGFYALSTICTHLGCTPNWLQAEQKFKCPCHGSGYYITGINFEGPAPRPLPRYNIVLADDGQIQVDKSIQYQYELGQWGLPGSFLYYSA